MRNLPVSNLLCQDMKMKKLLISQHLKVLERKLHEFASHGGLPFMANSDYSEEAAHGGLNAGESLDHEGSQTAEQTEEDNSSMQRDSPVSNGSLPAHGMSSASFGKHQTLMEGWKHLNLIGIFWSMLSILFSLGRRDYNLFKK
ncbi:hypothetical protein OIU76_001514 [Salix suchowensis]|nr:hypothetical protein OIU76_001514 [Salix suchowensis]